MWSSLSPILFVNGLLKEVEQAGLEVELSTIGGMYDLLVFVKCGA